jgi:RNA polymerase sigma-70 factor, ECF subfamily
MTQAEQISDNTYNEIVNNYKDKVVNTCFGFVHQTEDAEDIAQEVFIEIYNSFSGFKNNSQLSTWIYRISVNKSLDFIKRKNRKKRFGYIQGLFNQQDEALPIADDNAISGEKSMEIEDEKKALYEALTKLPENQKIAITLNKIEGLPAKEITQIMDISLSSVEALIHRAKSSLKKYLYNFYEKNMK